MREIAEGRGLLGGLKLYRLFDTQRPRYLRQLQRTRRKSYIVRPFFPCFSPRSARHLVLHLSFPAVSALSLLTTTYHSYRSGHNPGSSDILLAQSSWPSRAASHISPPSPTISFQVPTFGNFQHHFLIQRLSTNFIQPSRYPYPAIIHILRHLDFGRLSPLLRSESTIPP